MQNSRKLYHFFLYLTASCEEKENPSYIRHEQFQSPAGLVNESPSNISRSSSQRHNSNPTRVNTLSAPDTSETPVGTSRTHENTSQIPGTLSGLSCLVSSYASDSEEEGEIHDDDVIRKSEEMNQQGSESVSQQHTTGSLKSQSGSGSEPKAAGEACSSLNKISGKTCTLHYSVTFAVILHFY